MRGFSSGFQMPHLTTGPGHVTRWENAIRHRHCLAPIIWGWNRQSVYNTAFVLQASSRATPAAYERKCTHDDLDTRYLDMGLALSLLPVQNLLP